MDIDQLSSVIISLFNNLLGRPPQIAIKMDRIHRALRPKGRATDPPRDVICCICDFQLKEDILRNAKLCSKCLYEGTEIQVYQDLSTITLQHRRDLRPLLDALHDKNIIYRWKFPFGLLATNQGHSALLRVPEDLQPFCNAMGIPYIEAPNWYADFRFKTNKKDHTQEDTMETAPTRYRRRRSQSGDRHLVTPKVQRADLQSTGSPCSRKSRREY